MPALRKELVALTPADIQSLITEGWTEDEQLEFKQTLAHNSQGQPDPWLADQRDIRPGAKRDLLAEVVAMANTYGGDLVLGVAESAEKPPRAAALHPIPACVELAARLEQTARDVIKPAVPLLAVRGIPLDGHAGVVVIRAPRSRMAPHRLEIKDFPKECYRRVNDSTVPMSMREIQDLTFATARGLDAIDRKLATIRLEFMDWYRKPGGDFRWRGYLVAAVPETADLYLPRVHGVEAIKPVSVPYRLRFAALRGQFDLYPIQAGHQWRPILRGTQVTDDRDDRSRVQRLMCDGTIIDMTRLRAATGEQLAGVRADHVLYPGWLFATVCNVLEGIHRFRTAAAATSVQYALEIHIASFGPLPVHNLNDAYFLGAAGAFPDGITSLMRYAVGDRDSWQDTLTLVMADFWNAAGSAMDNGPAIVDGLIPPPAAP